MKFLDFIFKLKLKNDLIKDHSSINQSVDNDTNSPIRLGILFIFIGFGGFLLWAGLAPLDEGVPCQGSVTIDTKRKVVQHLTGGIIRQINVKEGDVVKAGEVLIVLDKNLVQAKLEEIRQRYIGERALEGRLLAEQLGLTSIKFHDDLVKEKNNLLVSQHMANQSLLLHSRRSSLVAELQGIEEAINGQNAQIEGLLGVLESRDAQAVLLNEQADNIRGLVEDGYAPKIQLRDLQIRIAQITGDIADTKSAILKSKKGIAELKQRSLSRKEDYKKDVETQMAQVRIEVNSDSDKLKALMEEFDQAEIKSPVAGQIVGLQVQTLGAVIQPGQKILDVVPEDEGLLVEVKIAPNLIDRVARGQLADVRFSTFAQSPQLSVEGIVDSISNDLLVEPGLNPMQPGATYYLARVSITPIGVKKLDGRLMQSGMPVEVVIKTGERTLLTYLMHPFSKRIAASFKEE